MARTKFYSKCKGCNKDFPNPPSSFKKYCSADCRRSHKYITLECNSCGDSFKRLKCNHIESNSYCSRKCYLEAHKTKPKKCKGCGEEFTKPGDPSHKYCTWNCFIKNVERNGNKVYYNKQSIPIIEEYGKEKGYTFRHAENGGEFFVRGYWVDAYDEDKNVVLEYMEKHHKYRKDYDKKRKSEIIQHLGCKWVEIWEK